MFFFGVPQHGCGTQCWYVMSIAVAVSGGVDSLYALASLCIRTKEIFALHARFLPVPEGEASDPVPGLKSACRALNVPLRVVDLSEPFRRLVIEPFIRAYVAAETPNPCALCNRDMKFGLLLDAAHEAGATHLATGHYATLTDHPRYGLIPGKADDSAKDQSYFLALTPRERLCTALFPAGRRTKKEVRDELVRLGIDVPLPRESQEICFVPGDDYRAFLKASDVSLPGPGPIVTVEGREIGRHEGLWRYTEGQRRGLGLAWSEPLYVVRKNPHDNTLTVGPRSRTTGYACTADSVNVLASPELWPAEVLVRTRYRQAAAPAEVCLSNGRLHIRFHAAQALPAPGQVAAVFDDSGHVLAGGIIVR